MIISTTQTPPKIYSNINTVITTGRFSYKIKEDICQKPESKPITPAQIVKTGKCLSQPRVVILIDVNGYNGRAKLELIGAIGQLVAPFPNHRISIHFGGLITPEAHSIDLDNVNFEEVLDRVIRKFDNLNGYNQNPIRNFHDELVDLHLEKVILGDSDVIFTVLTTMDRIHHMAKIRAKNQSTGIERQISETHTQVFVLDFCEPDCEDYEMLKTEILPDISLPEHMKIDFVTKFTWMMRMRQFTKDSCAYSTQEGLKRQSVCSKYDRNPLKMAIYLDTSIHINRYHLKFYNAVIQMVLKQLSSVHITNTGRNEIVIKKFVKRGQ